MSLAAKIRDGDMQLQEAFLEFDRNLRVRQTRVAGVLGAVLMLAGFTLDYFVYPSLLGHLFRIRLLCDAALLPFVVVYFTPWGRRHIKLVDKACIAIPTVFMCWMIFASEGTVSPYYAGLNLVVTGTCLLLPYSLAEATGVCLFILACYTLACLAHRSIGVRSGMAAGMVTDASTLFNNLYFLALTSIIAVTACRFSWLRRFEDFRLRHELDVNNRELASTLKKLQDTEVQLVQSEKMNALGKLSAGLLHEVNNPLNFTFMALQMAEQEAEGNASLLDTLKDIGQGMTRIRGVVSDLRAFAHPTNGTERESFGIDEALTTALRLCAHEMGDIPVVRKDIEGVKAIGSKTQIVHVFMNLLVNASHATRKKKVISPQITVACEAADGRLELSVLDNGTGVKQEHLPRLLEPFFTTKDVGQGMGLGLSICHTIVKNHGGNIKIATEEGEWTRVSFDLSLEPTKTISLGDARPTLNEEQLALAGSNA
jgi:two-component system, sensor histidine kinase PhcS